MTTDDRDKFIAILSRLESDHAGERDAAALAAVRMLKRLSLTWGDVIGGAQKPTSEHAPYRPYQGPVYPNPWASTPYQSAAANNSYQDVMQAAASQQYQYQSAQAAYNERQWAEDIVAKMRAERAT